MAPRASKQTERKAGKAKKTDDEHPSAEAVTGGDLIPRIKALFMGSCIVQNAMNAPKLLELLQNTEVAKAPAPVEQKKEEETEKQEAEGEKETVDPPTEQKETKEGSGDTANDMFEALCNQLSWCNVLGLAEPASGEEALAAWKALRELELDFGPRAKKRGSPGLDRIVVNLYDNFSQYMHLLLALMMLRSFLFRSFFACLPWLVGYQLASVLLPLTNLAKLPQVPLEQVPTKFRVAGTLAIHALVWLFFLYEAVWKMRFFEKIPVVGLFIYHAYAVRPQGQ